jgi:hypothetical protein
MTKDPRDEDYLGLFQPKGETPGEGATEESGPYSDDAVPPVESASAPVGEPVAEPDDVEAVAATVEEPPPPEEESWASPDQEPEPADDVWYVSQPSGEGTLTIQTLGAVAGAGCLLLMLTAVVVFAFVQVFVRGGDDEDAQVTTTPTLSVAVTPTTVPTAIADVESPTVAPLVSSTDVQVILALPQRLVIDETTFTVLAAEAPTGPWPDAPETADTANWALGTVVNYIFSLAPTQANQALLFALENGDAVSLDMSTGIRLNFTVSEKHTGAIDEAEVFSQTSPRLTLVVPTGDPAQRTVLTAAYFDDEPQVIDEAQRAAIGLIGAPVVQGPVRITVLETYLVAAQQAGLPSGTGYLLLDVTVENIGDEVLEPRHFQSFLTDEVGNRYPLTFIAEQFAHYGFPTEPLAPGETVIGSYGYLVTANLGGEFRWVFNPRPATEDWVVVPLAVDAPPVLPTPQPTPLAGFAAVTVQNNDVFINRADGVLDIGLRIENTSVGVVRVTEDDIGLSSWTDGDLTLLAPAPPLPWVIEPGELRLFQLQYQIPTADSALLTVLGYTFSIENLGGD